MTELDPRALINQLLRPQAYDHAVERLCVQETHISWVLLTGSFAYKIKKPVKLDFVDFSTLARRRFFCYEELRLNRRLAPRLYHAVVPISVVAGNARMDSDGSPVEYAVKMSQFPQESLLSVAVEQGRLRGENIDQLAAEVARFHQRIEVADPHQSYGMPGRICQPVRANFQELFHAALSRDRMDQLEQLYEWSNRTYQEREQDMLARRQQGFVRECHGDMHLGNMILDDGTVTVFDCIEFNEDFRWIDVINEVAFCFMDLRDRGREDLAYRFLNGYLQLTGDYSGLILLPFYALYRALVRAKVDWIRLRQELATASPSEVSGVRGHAAESRTVAGFPDSPSAETSMAYAEADQALFDQLHGYLDLAQEFAKPQPCYILMTHGVSGSGKTYSTQLLLEALGAIRLRSDVERKRISGVNLTGSSHSRVGAQMYAPSATARTYERLLSQADVVLKGGFPVILDGAFLRREQREGVYRLALQRRVPFRILRFGATPDTLRRRIVQRAATGRDASEADLAVLAHQWSIQEPLESDEREWAVEINSEARETGELVQRVVDALGRSLFRA